MAIKLLRNRETGVIHAWNPHLADHPDMEVYREPRTPNKSSKLPVNKVIREKLVAAFGDAEGIHAATRAELLAVDGVGAKTVDTILAARED